MANYFVSVIRPRERSLAWEAHNWIAKNLETALRGMGHTALVVQDWLSLEATNILIGAQQMDDSSLQTIPPGTVIYNLEPLVPEEVSSEFLRLAERHRIWDGSPQNLPLWQAQNCIHPPLLMEVCYLPEMRTLHALLSPDIDVLIFGSLDGEHRKLIAKLRAARACVVLTEGTDRPSSEALVARAKIVLSLHSPDARLMEKVWTTFLLANSKALLSEAPPAASTASSTAASCVTIRAAFPVTLPLDRMAGACLDLIADRPSRLRLETEGFHFIAQKNLRRAMVNALPQPPRPIHRDGERESRELYLDMVQKTVLNLVYEDTDTLGQFGFDSQRRELGLDRPARAHSMIGNRRMANLREIAALVITANIPGDFIETGVWRGGSCIMMRAILKAYGILDRRVWVADSFCGLPPPDPRYASDAGSRFHLDAELAVPLDQVQRNFAKYGLLDDRVCFLQGWFSDTLPLAPIERLAILRLDGDLYESTTDALTNLYHKVSEGGFIIVDDYAIPTCRAAVSDFRQQAGIIDPIEAIDGSGVFWRKTAPALPAFHLKPVEQPSADSASLVFTAF